MEGNEKLVQLVEETPNRYGCSWFGREFYKVQGPTKRLGQLP